MSAVQHASVSQTSSPRPEAPPSPASSSTSSTSTSEELEDEIDKPAVTKTSEPNAIPPPEVPEIPETLLQILKMDTFCQILDLDEEGDHEFSLSMVEAYFDQAKDTFQKLDKNFSNKNLSELSTLGHFFKGSSAAIGLEKVQASCEKIQHYGVRRDEEAKKDLKPEEALDKIKNQLVQLREEYAEAKQTLEDWFREHED